jgi:ubiquinone/menaquinone biosynthesis C-methylase UbiE
MDNIDRKEFWDKKILNWENDKYNKKPLLKFVNFNHSVQERQRLTIQFLKNRLQGKVVFEGGCGSARLLESFRDFGIKKYIGVDISEAAINDAKTRAQKLGLDQIELIQGSLSELPPQKVDICFTNGVLDWMELDDINKFIQTVETKDFLHTYSEKRTSLAQWAHQAYVFCMYGYKTKKYVPQYYTQKTIEQFFQKTTDKKLNFYRSNDLTFSTFVANFNYE